MNKLYNKIIFDSLSNVPTNKLIDRIRKLVKEISGDFDLKIGELSEPGLREDGRFVFFVVREAEALRAVGDEFLLQLKQNALEAWITDTRGQQDIQTTFDSAQYDWLVNQLRNSSRV